MEYLIIVNDAELARPVSARSAEEAIDLVRRRVDVPPGARFRILSVDDRGRPAPHDRHWTRGSRVPKHS